MDIDEPIFLQSVLSPAQTDSYDFVEAKETIGRRELRSPNGIRAHLDKLKTDQIVRVMHSADFSRSYV
ncbi:hypothetical protein GEV33_004917 [Tenebrio molitor]|uniref:Uncharacterized protein n=1 Tax=Tenebrio molitor TaxID=7067 RepID=A0A8J6HNU0_TENMO|nr:hypothetical protein GEV33_004917 [Tenebrio molitor]